MFPRILLLKVFAVSAIPGVVCCWKGEDQMEVWLGGKLGGELGVAARAASSIIAKPTKTPNGETAGKSVHKLQNQLRLQPQHNGQKRAATIEQIHEIALRTDNRSKAHRHPCPVWGILTTFPSLDLENLSPTFNLLPFLSPGSPAPSRDSLRLVAEILHRNFLRLVAEILHRNFLRLLAQILCR